MKATSVSGRERPFPSAGFDAGEPQTLRLALTIVFEPQGGTPARVISCEVTRADFSKIDSQEPPMKAARKTSGSRAAALAASLTREGAEGEAIDRPSIASFLTLVIAGIAVLMALMFVAPRSAHATESPYCGGHNTPPKEYCFGATRTFNAEYGTGDQGSVCVGSGAGGVACSGGPGQGVYKAVGQWITTEPWIFNNLAGQWNIVHGIAFTP